MAKKDLSFSLSNGLVDHLNLEKFNSKCGLMIYLKLHEQSQRKERMGKGEIALRPTSNDLKSSDNETFLGFVNLECVKFVEFKMIPDKNILNPKGLEFFKRPDVQGKLFKKILNENENKNKDGEVDPYELGIKFVSSLKLSNVAKYLEYLYLPNLRFKYSIINYKDKKKLKTETSFDSDMYRILGYFKRAKYFNDPDGMESQGEFWKINNLKAIKDMFRELRATYSSTLGDQFCVEFVEDMIDYAMSNKYIYDRTYSFQHIRKHEQEIKDGVRKFREIVEILEKQPARKEKIRLMIKVTEKVMGVKLSPSQKKMVHFYYYDISDMDIRYFKKALVFISDKETFERGSILNFKEIVKSSKTYEEELRKREIA